MVGGLGGGQPPVYGCTALLEGSMNVVVLGARHWAISGPPAAAAGSVSQALPHALIYCRQCSEPRPSSSLLF